MLDDYEEFSEVQKQILNKYVTSTSSHVFALRNLPEVIKGAIFSRYSRSSLGLRSLLLKEFISNDETLFQHITGEGSSNETSEDQMLAIKKAQNFYDRILDGYGDDSVGELGGSHIAFENISILAAKALEDARIGGSPLEKSTRYIYFDHKLNGEFLYYREPVLMASAYKDEYIETCNHLFEAYGALIPPLTEIMEKKIPKDPEISNGAYNAALRANVLDCLRGLLPASTFTNMGIFGNGRFFETLIQRMHASTLTENRDIAKRAHTELEKVIPSFVRRAEAHHRHCLSSQNFQETMTNALRKQASKYAITAPTVTNEMVRLINSDPDSPIKVASALIYAHGNASLEEIREHLESLDPSVVEEILADAARYRENRRHKSPRALEHAEFTFELCSDFGAYRDLQRHRMLTQERQILTCSCGYYIPDEILGTEMETTYRKAMNRAKALYEKISKELPEEAQYVVPMAFNIRWYFKVNLRALQWLTELRSTPQGHPTYRLIAQKMAHEVIKKFPEFERFLGFVDFEGYHLGRLDQEVKTEKKKMSKV